MKTRLNPYAVVPEAFKPMMALEQYIRGCGLEFSLIELVKTRASQINGCAYCIDMHVKDALKAGEDVERMYMLSAWRESHLYSERERAALAWTEALTTLSASSATDELYEELGRHFTQEEMTKLSLLIGTINVWNRINVGFSVPQPK